MHRITKILNGIPYYGVPSIKKVVNANITKILPKLCLNKLDLVYLERFDFPYSNLFDSFFIPSFS